MDSLFSQLDVEAPVQEKSTPVVITLPVPAQPAKRAARSSKVSVTIAVGAPSTRGAATLPNAAPVPGQRNAPLTISALSTHILALFERDELLRDLWVVGEVSNWKRAASGHIYFSLKDAGGTISAVMWRASAVAQRWLPQEGDLVHAHGSVSIYPERGQYQMYVNELQPVGRGQLYAAYEALKERLAAAGYFDAARKRPIPERPQRIAIVTSTATAALRDILRILYGRWPMVEVLLFPALVQGSEAPAQVVAALANANRYSEMLAAIDVIIVARGGGSIEDLWCFNDEQVAHAIFNSRCPIVTGVGHETDFTIVDFVADLRAPTPSAAAAACVPDSADLRAQLHALRSSLAQDVEALLENSRAHFAQRQLRLQRLNPERILRLNRQQVDERTRRLGLAGHTELAALRGRDAHSQFAAACAQPAARARARLQHCPG